MKREVKLEDDLLIFYDRYVIIDKLLQEFTTKNHNVSTLSKVSPRIAVAILGGVPLLYKRFPIP